MGYSDYDIQNKPNNGPSIGPAPSVSPNASDEQSIGEAALETIGNTAKGIGNLAKEIWESEWENPISLAWKNSNLTEGVPAFLKEVPLELLNLNRWEKRLDRLGDNLVERGWRENLFGSDAKPGRGPTETGVTKSEYCTEWATIKCSMSSHYLDLTLDPLVKVNPRRKTYGDRKHLEAVQTDAIRDVNVPVLKAPWNLCFSLVNPLVLEATLAKFALTGTFTIIPLPCCWSCGIYGTWNGCEGATGVSRIGIPKTSLGAYKTTMDSGMPSTGPKVPALTKKATLSCAWLGTISIVTSGRNDHEVPYDLVTGLIGPSVFHLLRNACGILMNYVPFFPGKFFKKFPGLNKVFNVIGLGALDSIFAGVITGMENGKGFVDGFKQSLATALGYTVGFSLGALVTGLGKLIGSKAGQWLARLAVKLAPATVSKFMLFIALHSKVLRLSPQQTKNLPITKNVKKFCNTESVPSPTTKIERIKVEKAEKIKNESSNQATEQNSSKQENIKKQEPTNNPESANKQESTNKQESDNFNSETSYNADDYKGNSYSSSEIEKEKVPIEDEKPNYEVISSSDSQNMDVNGSVAGGTTDGDFRTTNNPDGKVTTGYKEENINKEIDYSPTETTGAPQDTNYDINNKNTSYSQDDYKASENVAGSDSYQRTSSTTDDIVEKPKPEKPTVEVISSSDSQKYEVNGTVAGSSTDGNIITTNDSPTPTYNRDIDYSPTETTGLPQDKPYGGNQTDINSQVDTGDVNVLNTNDAKSPSVGSDTSKPSTNGNTNKPSGSSDTGKPSTNNDAGKPSTNNDAGKPSTNNDTGKPSTNNDTGKPSTNNDTGKPSTNNDAGKPSTNNDTGKPSTNNDAGKPSTNNDASKPSTNNDTGKPSTNNDVDKPSSDDGKKHPIKDAYVSGNANQSANITDELTEEHTGEGYKDRINELFFD